MELIVVVVVVLFLYFSFGCENVFVHCELFVSFTFVVSVSRGKNDMHFMKITQLKFNQPANLYIHPVI